MNNYIILNGNTFSNSTSITVAPIVSNNSTLSNIPASTTSQLLLPANPSRLFCFMTNNSNRKLYILLGTGTVNSSNFSCYILPASYWEVPITYTGPISGVWDSGMIKPNGNLLITELI